MSDLISASFLTAVFVSMLSYGIPVLLAAIGQTIDQRAGVLDIGVEGTMLIGCYVGFAAAYEFDSIWIGFLAAAVAGAVVSLVVIVLHIRLRLDVVVIGIATVILAQGTTSVLFNVQYASKYPRLGAPLRVAIPWLSEIPVIGPAVFNAHPVMYGTLILALVVAWMLKSTRFGLNLRAAGDSPEALDRSGVSVLGTRAAAHGFAGAMAGLAGGYMVLVSAGVFVPLMVNGAGFVALMVTMLARGRMALVGIGSLLFGGALALVTALQLAGINIPSDLIQLLPFAMLILVLFTFSGRAGLPPYLARPYERGAR